MISFKVRLQTAAKATPGGGGVGSQLAYAGAFDCFRKTFVEEGIFGFYKGKFRIYE